MSEPKPVMSDEEIRRTAVECQPAEWHEGIERFCQRFARRLLAEFAERVASRVFPCQGQECNRSTVWCPNCTRAAAVREAAKGADRG